MWRGAVGAIASFWLLACAGAPLGPVENTDYGLKDGFVWVRGPWEAIEPSTDMDAVIDQLCPAVMVLPRARGREYGQEYCGALYVLGNGTYYASMPSPLGPILKTTPETQKACKLPSVVHDPRGTVRILADYHSHPWADSPLSKPDRSAARQRWLIRIQFDTKCRVMKLVPYIGEPRPGEVYERRGKSWALIGIIKPEHKATGTITAVGGPESETEIP
jgi:proteasome lid subunit RPN8/RPN11